MKKMSAYIDRPGVATTMAALLLDEIEDNASAVSNYTHDWAPADIEKCRQCLAAERAIVLECAPLVAKTDSVKGEIAMAEVYATDQQQKAVDVITKKDSGELSLIELKYVMKFAGPGPFSRRKSFRDRISDKLSTMAGQMEPDGETIDPLRIVVVTEEQLPYSIDRVRALVSGGYPPGTFSSDGLQHSYVLCTSATLRQMVDDPPVAVRDSGKYLFFTL